MEAPRDLFYSRHKLPAAGIDSKRHLAELITPLPGLPVGKDPCGAIGGSQADYGGLSDRRALEGRK